jgi:WD40 repeat protein
VRVALTFLLLIAAPASAAAAPGFVYGVCGTSLCRVDVKHRQRSFFRRGSVARPYTWVSVSTSGSRLAFVRDGVVYSGRRHPRRLGTGSAVYVSPNGGAVSWPDGTTLMTDRGPVATGVTSAGWLATLLLRDVDGTICVVDHFCVAADPGHVLSEPTGSPDGRRVAAVRDGTTIALFDGATGKKLRDLTDGFDRDPSFSPDGKRIAFTRGRDTWTAPTGHYARAHDLVGHMIRPAWAKR